METISIKVEVSKSFHTKLLTIQKNIRKETGRKVALSQILLKFALKGIECLENKETQKDLEQKTATFSQNESSFEQNLGQSVQNKTLTAQNLARFVQNTTVSSTSLVEKLQKVNLNSELEQAVLLRQRWEKRFEFLADYERHLESMEKRLEIKTRELSRKEEELKTAMQQQINNCVKLESYEFEVERLRQEKEQLTEQINSLIARDDYMNTLAREAAENKRQISLALEKIDEMRNSV